MSWIEIRARYSPLPEDTSPIVDVFRDHGIENTQEEGDAVIGCIADVEGAEAIVNELALALREGGASEVATRELEEENWEAVWRQFFKPRRIGRRFVIRPTWEEFAAEPGDHVIVLDPGQAFGTGDHPTTRLCLELLERAEIEGKRLADVGCGSGILAIAAAQLGAAEVQAVDIDPIAVEVTKENAALNGVSFRAVVGEGIASLTRPEAQRDLAEAAAQWEQDEKPLGRVEAPGERSPEADEVFDVVVSNIISAILIRIAPDVAPAVKPEGKWIVSGIIPQNWPDVQAAAERNGFVLEEKLEEDGWVAARFRREAA